MTPVEAIGRAVCDHLSTHPDTWRGFEPAILKALEAFLTTLPPDLEEAVRGYLETVR